MTAASSTGTSSQHRRDATVRRAVTTTTRSRTGNTRHANGWLTHPRIHRRCRARRRVIMSDPMPTLDLGRSHGRFTPYPRELVLPEGSIVLVTCSACHVVQAICNHDHCEWNSPGTKSRQVPNLSLSARLDHWVTSLKSRVNRWTQCRRQCARISVDLGATDLIYDAERAALRRGRWLRSSPVMSIRFRATPCARKTARMMSLVPAASPADLSSSIVFCARR